jgi:hypothetical protein
MLSPEELRGDAATAVPSGKPGDPDLEVQLAVGEAPVSVESFDETDYQLFEMEFLCQLGRLRFLDFGCQIHWEQVEVSAIGERELKPRPPSPWQGLVSPLYLPPIYQKKCAFKHGYPFAAQENQGIETNYYPGACPNAEKLYYE